MKLLPAISYRRWVFAGMLFLALSLGTSSQIFSTSLHAQTSANAPAGTASNEIDKATGKPIITTASGLKYVDLAVGKGPTVKTGDHVTVTYVGTLTDGTKFDASADHPPGTFDYVQGITALIAGWTEGTSTMKAGGERKLIIPPQLGYGQDGQGPIPPNATLIFDIKLISINPS